MSQLKSVHSISVLLRPRGGTVPVYPRFKSGLDQKFPHRLLHKFPYEQKNN
jgi:hypothetical protein